MGRTALAVLVAVLWLGMGHAAGQTLRLAVLADRGGGPEAEGARRYLQRMETVLTRCGVAYDVLTQDDVVSGRLDGFKVAVVPYAPNLSGTVGAALRTFCDDGGKVMCFYDTHGLDSQLGLRSLSYVQSPDRTLFRRVRMRQDAVPGLPDGFDQVSWNIRAPAPEPGTIVLADWLDQSGRESGHVAATLSDGGFYFSHVLLAEGEENERKAGRMIEAAARYLAQKGGKRQGIAVVYGTVSREAGASDSRLVGRMVGEMERILTQAGVSYAVLTDEAVARGALTGRRAAIFPLNFQMSDAEVQAVQSFVAGGGKVVGMFSVEKRILPLMGVAEARFLAGGPSSPFGVVSFSAAAPRGFPERFTQASSNISDARPAPDGTVVASWCDATGKDTGRPAVILSPTGMYFSYVLWAGDVEKTSQFMLAGLACLVAQDLYADAAGHALATLWDFRRYRDRDSLIAACQAEASARLAVADAVRLEDQARQGVAAGRPAEAYAALKKARAAAELAFVRSLTSRGGREFRGAWIHSVDVPDFDWERFFAGMQRAHLNALLPNVCAGGYAHYESSLLPLSALIKENGPQVDKMLAAARRHGIEVHLWRVNYNLWRPGKEVVDRMAAQGRVCLDPTGRIVGGPDSATLCPSNPENQRLEIDAMLEMARKFRPDGIHFDYIRYPSPDACYCPGCRERFETRIGARAAAWPQDVLPGGPLRDKYLQFRRDQITLVVREVSRAVRSAVPGVKISAAVFSQWDSARDSVGQDWVNWVKDGYLDFVCPMNYTQEPEELAATVAKQRTWVAGRIPLCSGIGAWQSPSAWQTADLVDTARKNGADGLVFFEYRGRVADELIPLLVEGPLRQTAVTP
jgi:uncharacterized lipoprotein YddW (UPF0748 family)